MTYLPLGWATDFFDYDQDGDQDLFFANGQVYPTAETMQPGITDRQRSQLLENVPGPAGSDLRVFVDVSDQAGDGFSIPRSHRAGGPFDYDRDDDLDLGLTEIDGCDTLMRNELPPGGWWIAFRPVGRASNRPGIGTRFLLTAGKQVQVRETTGSGSYLWGRDPRAHFGLGEAGGTVDVEVIWPGGRRQKFAGLPVGREFVVEAGADRPVEKAVTKR